jgi:hypothetical protein
MDKTGAYIGMFLYGIFPINVYYSRAIMPESAALFFMIGGIYYFNRWIKSSRKVVLSASALFSALAIMTKPPTLFVFLLFLALCWMKFRWKLFIQPSLWFFVVSVLCMVSAYYWYSISIADYKFSLGITHGVLFKQFAAGFPFEKAFPFFKKAVPKAFTYTSVFFLPFALLSIKKSQSPLLILFIAILLETCLIVSMIRATYYLVFLTIPVSLLLGNFLSKLFKHPLSYLIALEIIILISYSSYLNLSPMYRINTIMQTQINVVSRITNADDLLVVGSIDPCLLDITDRRGWRYGLGLASGISKNMNDVFYYYIQSGAKYFVPIQGKIYNDKDGKIIEYLNRNFQKIEPIKGYPIYWLH